MEQTVIKTQYTKAEVDAIFEAFFANHEYLFETKDDDENIIFIADKTCTVEEIDRARKVLSIYGSEYHFTEVEYKSGKDDLTGEDFLYYIFHTNMPYQLYFSSRYSSNIVEFEFAQ